MSKLSDLKSTNSHIKLLAYGESGAGKSVFATSFPGPIYVHDFDKKIVSAANFWRKANPEQLNAIEYCDYGSIVGVGSELDVIAEDTTKKRFATFNGWIIEAQKQVREGTFKYQTVVLDSLTLWSELLLKEVIRQTKGKIAQPIKGMEGNAGMQHYGLNQRFFKEYLHQLLDLPCNVVITAHVTEYKDEVTGLITYRPKATGQLAEYLPCVFGEVYRVYVENVGDKTHRKLQTVSDRKFNCRTQISDMPAVVEASYKSLTRS